MTTIKIRLLLIVLFPTLFFSLPSWGEEAVKNPVSESSSSSSSEKSFNVQIDPLSMLIGWLNLSVMYKVSDRVTVGPTFTNWNFDFLGDKWKVNGFGARLNYFIDDHPYADGTYVAPFIRSFTMEVDTTFNGFSASGKTDALIYGAYWGKQWMWDNINMIFGISYSVSSLSNFEIRNTNGDTQDIDLPSTSSGVGLEWKVGLTF